jgi:hypothetical protein
VNTPRSTFNTGTMAPAQPELKKYIDKRLFVQLNGSRKVIGVLRGYDVSFDFAPASPSPTHVWLIVFPGIPEHRSGRGGRGEGEWGQGADWHGGKGVQA